MQRDLVERARRGDHDAFAVLAASAVSRLDGAAWLILRDADQAKDAVQNALLQAWRELPTLRDPDRFDAWLHRIVINACLSEARRSTRHRIEADVTALAVPSPDTFESAVVNRDQIERGFLRLEPEMRAVIVLHYYLDLTMPDVAASLGIPLGTAKSRLNRAIGLLRAALDAEARNARTVSEGRPA
jgi:RNA polymerase sigma-70 factor, ECF subfamily